MSKSKVLAKLARNLAGKLSGEEKIAAEKRLKRKGKGIALGLSKNKSKTIEVEAVQKRIREAAKKKGLSVKAYRQKNPNNASVKKLYGLKPNIKSADALRKGNKQTMARRRARDTASKKAGTFTGFERDTRATFTKAELEILRKEWNKAGGKSGTGQTFTEFKKQYKGKYFDS